MAYLEELLPEFRKGAKIRRKKWENPNGDYFEYIYTKGRGIYSNYGTEWLMGKEALWADDWEIYQEPIDWDYIIKNKCLCFFWGTFFDTRIIGTLEKINEDSQYNFKIDHGKSYENCRPVRRDEVTFHEDRKDEDER